MSDKVIRDTVYGLYGYTKYNVPIKKRREMTQKFLQVKDNVELYMERYQLDFETSLKMAIESLFKY